MKQHYFRIGNEDWGVVVCYDLHREDLPEISSLLSELGATPLKRKRALNIIRTLNSGFTYSDYERRMSLMCIGQATSDEEMFDGVLHEVKHLVEHISNYYDVHPKSEPAAYLQGEVGQKLYMGARGLVCPTCGRGG